MKNTTYFGTRTLTTDEARRLEHKGFTLELVKITLTEAVYNIYASQLPAKE